jgi:hypothetical protein
LSAITIIHHVASCAGCALHSVVASSACCASSDRGARSAFAIDDYVVATVAGGAFASVVSHQGTQVGILHTSRGATSGDKVIARCALNECSLAVSSTAIERVINAGAA